MPTPLPTNDGSEPRKDRPDLRNDHTEPSTEHPDRTIFRWAEKQHGLVARRQLLGDGVPPHVIAYRLRTGRLTTIHRGVYRCGPVVASDSREMAALLACGERAALSHRTAATIWELILPPPQHRLPPVDVTSLSTRRGPSRGVRLYRVRRLDPDQVAMKRGLRVTTPSRTLVDFARIAEPAELERALALAERRGLVTGHRMETLLKEYPHRRGNQVLATALKLTGGPALTRSEAEVRFLSLVRRGQLPGPRTNVVVEGFEVDFFWPSHRLAVEIDGFAYHSGRDAFERDRERDATLTAAGMRVVRLTWRQLTERPEAVLVQVARALAGNSPQSSTRTARPPQV